jgi:hypothetical protein
MVHLAGTLNVVLAVTTDANGCQHIKVHYNPMGMTGIGQTTGLIYRATGVTQGEDKEMTLCGEQCEFTEIFVNRFNIIGPGPGNNLMVHETMRWVYNNCTSESTVYFDKLKIDCK